MRDDANARALELRLHAILQLSVECHNRRFGGFGEGHVTLRDWTNRAANDF